MKHKHCEVIKAWADGAEIQMYHPTNMAGEYRWVDDKTPSWRMSQEYRVKPDPPALGSFQGVGVDGCYSYSAIALTKEVRAALKAAGIEYGEE